MTPKLAPTAKDVVHREGTARLYRFRPARQDGGGKRAPVLLVPSLINRWYVFDLRVGASLASALVDAGLDVFCLDWGAPEGEDRWLDWDTVCARLARAVRRVKRQTGQERVSLLGYCMGGTLSAIHSALDPDSIASLVNLAGPIDFSKGGFLREVTHPRWFDPNAIADAGNVTAAQMQSGFQLLRPTLSVSKWIGFAERALDTDARDAFFALENWAGDNVDFPGEAYRTWIGEMYQENRLVKGEHHVAGRRVDLARIRCPILVVTAERDAICPPPSATALLDHARSRDGEVASVPGGHVGAVVGSRASRELYPRIAEFLLRGRRRAAMSA